MCAINPVHKKRLLIDVYTSDRTMSQQEFDKLVIQKGFETELRLNTVCQRLRWHVKETEQEAD